MKINDRDKSILQYIVRHCNRVNEDVESTAILINPFVQITLLKIR